MRILLANDDGIHAEGICALARQLSKKHQVTVVAPDDQRSGAAHSIMLTSPLKVRKASIPGAPEVEAYKVSGAPADCVILGLMALNVKPDVILTGINHGYNLGMDVHYSGTIGAAMEGAMHGVPSMAVSLEGFDATDFSVPARIADELLDEFINSGCMLFNVNVPDIPYEQIKGIKYTKLSDQSYFTPFEKRSDPRGVDYYWWPCREEYKGDPDIDNDERWTDDGYVSVTPIMINITDVNALNRLKFEQEK